MMVKDEQKNLARCLESLKPLTDNDIAELIIVDTGSKDKTPDIAGEYTSKLYYHEWNNDFSGMRNKTISYAKGEWLFIIDADEVLERPEELAQLFLDKDLGNYNTIVLQIGNVNSRKSNANIAYNPSPRIFRNDGTFKYVGSVHNQPLYKTPVFYTDISIRHYGYISDDKMLMDKKFERTRALLLNELKKSPSNIYYQFQLGVTYDMHGEAKKALKEFRKAYALLKDKNKNERASNIVVYGAYARCANNNKRHQEAIEICREGIRLRPEFIDFYYIMGASSMAMGSIQSSVDAFSKYIELVKNKNNLEITKDMTVIFYNIDEASQSNAYSILCQCYIELGDFEKAETCMDSIKSEYNRTLSAAKIYINQHKYSKLKEYYISLAENQEIKSVFIDSIEENIRTLNKEERAAIFEEFSSIQDMYGCYNKVRLYSGIKKEKALDEFLSCVDFNTASIFYADIFRNLFDDPERIFSILKCVNTRRIREVEKYLLDKYEESEEIFKEYLTKYLSYEGRFDDYRLYVALAPVLLVKHIEYCDDIGDDYYTIFKAYIRSGINYISQIYKAYNDYSLLKYINDEEDKFFILIHFVSDCMTNGDRKSAAKYMIEAVNTQKIFVKYIDRYKTEVFGQDSRDDGKLEFENYKSKVKQNISVLISQGLLSEAKEVIDQYETMIKGDIEILLYKSQIALMETK